MAFLLLTLREGSPEPYQRIIDSVFHNWMVLSLFVVSLWGVRSGWFGPIPRLLYGLAGLLVLFFALFLSLSVIASPLWQGLRLFRVPTTDVQFIAAMIAIAVWFFACVWFLFRGFLRWLGKRYQHHGVAVGFGPVYFYFRRRRVS